MVNPSKAFRAVFVDYVGDLAVPDAGILIHAKHIPVEYGPSAQAAMAHFDFHNSVTDTHDVGDGFPDWGGARGEPNEPDKRCCRPVYAKLEILAGVSVRFCDYNLCASLCGGNQIFDRSGAYVHIQE